MYSISEANALDHADFVRVFGGVYEHSPWVAEQVAMQRPFANADALVTAMQKTVESAPHEARLTLIRAHPELLGRLAPMDQLTADSRSEQVSAGLDQCTPEELDTLKALNRAYRDKFGFPFVVAVRGLTRRDIIARMSGRLSNDADHEFANSLTEISKIARLRIAILVS